MSRPPRTPVADPDRACAHEVFEADTVINRLTEQDAGPVVGFMADLRIRCAVR